MEHDLDAIRKNFSDMSTEALLDEWEGHAADYEPEALEMMKQELLRRGVTRGELEAAAAASNEPVPETGEAERIASFGTIVFAQQAQDILAQHGIDSTLQGMGNVVWGMESVAAVPGSVDVWVLQANAEAARKVLEEFTPVAEEREGIRLEVPPEEDPESET